LSASEDVNLSEDLAGSEGRRYRSPATGRGAGHDILTLTENRPGDDADRKGAGTDEARDRPDIADETRSDQARSDQAGSQQAAEDGADNKGAWDRLKAHPLAVGIVLLVVIAAVAAGVFWWLATRDYETTDDAFVDGRTVAVSSQVAGAIVDVPVTDNQLVDAGTVLARIDDRDYRASLGQAEAQIAQAQAGIANVDAQLEAQRARISQAGKQVTEAQATLSFSKDENARYQDLVRQGAGTVQRAQQAASDLQQKQAALDAATASELEAQRQIAVLQAQRKSSEAQLGQAQAQRDQASANLSRVTLAATVKGRVTRLTGAKGAYAVPGQTLMMLVPLDVWVTANYKETQLALMRPQQPATIEVDAYGRSFPGHVDSIQAGSGTAFSLLPAENATGNYVKVVQRVPVKIVFDSPPDVELGPGMSVVPSVKVQ
jgi:membrane fusion protein (multidrug efflux system)